MRCQSSTDRSWFVLALGLNLKFNLYKGLLNLVRVLGWAATWSLLLQPKKHGVTYHEFISDLIIKVFFT